MPEGMVGERAVRVDAVRHDLGDRISLDDVDPLEGGDQRLLRGGEGRRHACRGARSGRTRPPPRRRGHGARQGLAGCRREPCPGPLARAWGGPRRGCQYPGSRPRSWSRSTSSRTAGVRMRRRSAPAATREAAVSGAASSIGVGRVRPNQGRPASPRRPRSSSRAVRLASIRSSASAGDPAGLRLGRRPALGVGQQLRLEREVDGPARDVEGQLLGRDVVLEQGDRERQGDPGREARGRAVDMPLHHRRRQGHLVPVEAGHAEEAEHRAFPGRGRRGPGAGAPGSGEVLGAPEDAVETGFDRAARVAHRSGSMRELAEGRGGGPARAGSRQDRLPGQTGGSTPGSRRVPAEA